MKTYSTTYTPFTENVLNVLFNNHKIVIHINDRFFSYFNNIGDTFACGIVQFFSNISNNNINMNLISPITESVFSSAISNSPYLLNPIVIGNIYMPDIVNNLYLGSFNTLPSFYAYIPQITILVKYGSPVIGYFLAKILYLSVKYLLLFLYKLIDFIIRLIYNAIGSNPNNIFTVGLLMLSQIPRVISFNFNPRILEHASNHLSIPLSTIRLILASTGLTFYFIIAVIIDYMTNRMFVRGTLLGAYPMQRLYRNWFILGSLLAIQMYCGVLGSNGMYYRINAGLNTWQRAIADAIIGFILSIISYAGWYYTFSCSLPLFLKAILRGLFETLGFISMVFSTFGTWYPYTQLSAYLRRCFVIGISLPLMLIFTYATLLQDNLRTRWFSSYNITNRFNLLARLLVYVNTLYNRSRLHQAIISSILYNGLWHCFVHVTNLILEVWSNNVNNRDESFIANLLVILLGFLICVAFPINYYYPLGTEIMVLNEIHIIIYGLRFLLFMLSSIFGPNIIWFIFS